jgi:hypothetical protein
MILHALKKHEQKMNKMAAKMKVDDLNKNKEKTKAEVKIAKIAIMIVCLYILSWCPYALVALIGQFGNADLVTPYLSMLPVMLAKASAMHNPLVYALSHPKFREALYNKAPGFFSCCKPPSKSAPSATSGKNVIRTNSGQSDADGEASDVSSCVSDISDTRGNAIQMRKTGKGSNDQELDNNSTQLIQGLVQALISATTQQQNKQVIYLPNVVQNAQSPQAVDPNGVYMVANGGQQIDVQSYLQNIAAAERIATVADNSQKQTVEMTNETSASNKEKVEGKIANAQV